ncbi:hypothetical protein IV203_002634 [Nitzschia inconspicua]|uniref:Uncharacterized protein n=1 Tax=Nitzschia inconspicua TaxID=303405 RepID=A0A9K3K7M0_9STRA|nr:hypothetical protein IV203_002634 [Nitzschia inconspicua]
MELSSDGDEGGDDDESGSHPPPPPTTTTTHHNKLIPPPLLLLLSEEDIDHLLDTLLSSSFMEELRFLRDAQQAFEMAERHIGTVFPTMATMHRTTLARRMLDLGTVPRRNTMRSWLVDYFFDEERMIDEDWRRSFMLWYKRFIVVSDQIHSQTASI